MFDTLRDAVTAPIATLAETIQTAIVNLQADKQDESLAEEHDATADVKVNALPRLVIDGNHLRSRKPRRTKQRR